MRIYVDNLLRNKFLILLNSYALLKTRKCNNHLIKSIQELAV